MLTRTESLRLQAEMRRELDQPIHALWKCAAGLMFVTALVVTGAGTSVVPDAAPTRAAANR